MSQTDKEPTGQLPAKLEKLHTRIQHVASFFPGQREHETVQLCIRTHWLKHAIISLYFFGLAVLVPLFALGILSFFDFNRQSQTIASLVISFYLLFVFLFIFVELIKAELTVLVVTDERIVNIAQLSLFNQQISEANLSRIQEITGNTRGLFGTFLGVGKLDIQTAGIDFPLVINNVKQPHFTARKILDIQKSESQRRRVADFGRRQGDEIVMREGDTLPPEEILKMRKPPQPKSEPQSLRHQDEEGLG